jgi:receptor protein-tyrosine kinase
MSRLFEALSNLQVKRSSLGVISVTMAPPEGVRPDTPPEKAAARVAASEADHRKFQQSIAREVAEAPNRRRLNTLGVQETPLESHFEETPLSEAPPQAVATESGVPVSVVAQPESRLVALSNPNGLGAEKFRALVTRLDHFRKQSDLKSFQVTSSVIHEGKTVVAGNTAVTLAKYSGSKTLVIEGDLHRPMLSTLFGIGALSGLSDWWTRGSSDLAPFLHRLNDMSLWFLSAGKPCDRPSEILRSARFAKAFAQLASQFEWIVVDSTPMLPIVDVNLWSKLVDGTLLVVREGLTPVKALKKGLQALDQPKLIGVVMNETSESDKENYDNQYYSAVKPAAGPISRLS